MSNSDDLGRLLRTLRRLQETRQKTQALQPRLAAWTSTRQRSASSARELVQQIVLVASEAARDRVDDWIPADLRGPNQQDWLRQMLAGLSNEHRTLALIVGALETSNATGLKGHQLATTRSLARELMDTLLAYLDARFSVVELLLEDALSSRADSTERRVQRVQPHDRGY